MIVNYRDLPIGARAISSTGAYWTKTKHGWKANGGDTFPTPGGCVVRIEFDVEFTPTSNIETIIISGVDVTNNEG